MKKGSVMSAASRAKISAARIGHETTQETRDKIGAAFAGKPLSPQHVANINRSRSRSRVLRVVPVVAELSEQVAKLTSRLAKFEARLVLVEKWVKIDDD
jgi:hypothetical protein